jgi:small basic protein (TIGR04137 family)
MSLDRSLKTKGSLAKHRNVLSRTERIKILADQDRFDPEQDRPTGLPKVAHRKVVVGGKSKKKGPEGEEAAAEGEKAAKK